MKNMKFIFLIVLFFTSITTGMAREALFEKYIDKLNSLSRGRLTDIQKNELMRPRTLKDYDKNFYREKRDIYKNRRNYRDISRNTLIDIWKQNCPCKIWLESHELHHIIPLGYGGRNEWWNIFPLTFLDHRDSETGIHNCTEFTDLFPYVINH